MNILIVTAVFPPEPVVSAQISFDLANYLAKDNEVTVISPKPSRPVGYTFTDELLQVDYQHHYLESFRCPESKVIGRLRESISFGKACYSFIVDSSTKYDVIYMNTWPLGAQYFVIKAAKKLRIQVYTHIQDIYPESLTNKLRAFRKIINKTILPVDKFILRNSTGVITISEQMCIYLSVTRNIPNEKLNLVYNWQDESRFKVSSVEKNADTFTFLFLGSLSPTASISTIINAFKNLSNPNCELIIAGGGSEKDELIKLADNHYGIKFIDAHFNKAGEIQSSADVLILSLKKGSSMLALPSKLAAYMFSARPVIACVDLGSAAENAIKESKCGWVTQPESINDLTEVMKTAYKVKIEELKEMGERGKEYAISNFSRDVNLNKLAKILVS